MDWSANFVVEEILEDLSVFQYCKQSFVYFHYVTVPYFIMALDSLSTPADGFRCSQTLQLNMLALHSIPVSQRFMKILCSVYFFSPTHESDPLCYVLISCWGSYFILKSSVTVLFLFSILSFLCNFCCWLYSNVVAKILNRSFECPVSV